VTSYGGAKSNVRNVAHAGFKGNLLAAKVLRTVLYHMC